MPSPPVPAAEAARQRAQRQRLRRRLSVAIFAFPLFFLACALYLYFGPKPPPPPAIIPVTPQQAAQAEQHITAISQALTQPIPPSAPPHPSSPPAPTPPDTTPAPVRHTRGPQGEDVVTLMLTEADINAYLSGNQKIKSNLAARGVHALSVELTPPAGIVFHVNATLKKFQGNALVAATMTPDPRTAVQFNITDARFGRLPTPVVKAAADRIAKQLLGTPPHPLPLSVRKVEVQGTNLILTGVEVGTTTTK